MALLREGLSNEEIAERLGLSLSGAKWHVSEILSKLGVTGREEAARWEPERRPWWLVAATPFDVILRKAAAPWLSTATLLGVVIAVSAGIGLLAWGMARTGDADGERRVAVNGGPTAAEEPRATRRTGIAEVDAVIDAMEAGDARRVLDLIRFDQVPCSPPEDVLTVACRADETEGTLVDYVLGASCEGDRLMRSEAVVDDLAEHIVYAVYRAPEPKAGPQSLLDGDYVAVFVNSTGGLHGGMAMVIKGPDIVQFLPAFIVPAESLCAGSLEELIEAMELTDAVLPPLPDDD